VDWYEHVWTGTNRCELIRTVVDWFEQWIVRTSETFVVGLLLILLLPSLTVGSSAITAGMTVSALAFGGLAFTKKPQDRIFHCINCGITIVAAIVYFTFASNLAFIPMTVEFHKPAFIEAFPVHNVYAARENNVVRAC
jgi:hypothetical protein